MASPRSGAHAEVWAWLYGLSVGARVTVTDALRALPLELTRIRRAIARAEQAGLLRFEARKGFSKPGASRPCVWVRIALPSPVTTEGLVARGCSRTVAGAVLEALREAGLIRLTAEGFVAA